MNSEMLRHLRRSRSQRQVAKDLDVNKSALAMYERGERTPRDEVKIRIAAYYGKTVQELFFDQ